MPLDATPWQSIACIQSWKRIWVGLKNSSKVLSAKIASLEKVMPVACSHFLNWFAGNVVYLPDILAQESQISASEESCKSWCLVKELTVATWWSTSSGSCCALARKTFLHKQQNLLPLSPFHGHCKFVGSTIHDEEPQFGKKPLARLWLWMHTWLLQLQALRMQEMDLEPMVQDLLQQLAQMAIQLAHNGRPDHTYGHPSILALEVLVEFFEWHKNGPAFPGCHWCKHIPRCQFISINHTSTVTTVFMFYNHKV